MAEGPSQLAVPDQPRIWPTHVGTWLVACSTRTGALHRSKSAYPRVSWPRPGSSLAPA